MNKTYYVCKYTPIELLEAFGGECQNLNEMPQGFDHADQIAHPNICGFGKALLEAVMSGKVKELVLVNCCDTIRSVYDILEDSGKLDFLYMIDVLHCDAECSRERTAVQLKGLAKAYGEYKGTTFDEEKFRQAFKKPEHIVKPHISVLGARMGNELFDMVQKSMPYPVENDTCVNNRSVGETEPPKELEFDELMVWYAKELLGQIPCMRMMDHSGRKRLYNDPGLKGIIYHTVKFCDFYSFEYAQIKQNVTVPLLKIESDYTIQSSGQLLTRLEAFAESLDTGSLTEKEDRKEEHRMGKGYFAGIDSGSTSTDVVILNKDGEIVTGIILPTGAGAAMGAERALEEALKQAKLQRKDIDAMVTTGYGRTAITDGDKSITEITCHARGAHFLNPEVRTVIDIGGQDTKIICVEQGFVKDFMMNDKCSAGTGKFLEIMANRLGVTLQELFDMADKGTVLPISSLCTVFAESEVINYIGEGQKREDIAAGVVDSVANKVAQLAMKKNLPEKVILTGGLSNSTYFTKILSQKLGQTVSPTEHGRYAGALGAALLAKEKKKR